jgi:tRNA pseudouridine38-40 synthase
MRIALGLEYAGIAFNGWQSQPDGKGVQDALELALAAIASAPIRTVAAGRTDAGVHATMQVVHFDTTADRPANAWVRGVNAYLSSDVAVLWASPVDQEFNARYAARERHYTYLLANGDVRPALLAGRVGWCHRPLDVEKMRAGAAALIGTHDFSSFRAALCQARSPVRTLSRIAIAASGGYIGFDFSANAYLHHMIRNIVGALVYVGSGRHPSSWIDQLLQERDRTRAAPTFAADGLYFTGADYNPAWGLPPTRRAVTLPLA